jgi:cytidine deaminase
MMYLVARAHEAREHAYAPYSGFAVGAAVLTASGRIYTGVNVENASYGLTVCAERVAIAGAIAAGERELVAIAIVAGSASPTRPCGACLQVMAEFNPGMSVIVANLDGQSQTHTLPDLLPQPFGLKNSSG